MTIKHKLVALTISIISPLIYADDVSTLLPTGSRSSVYLDSIEQTSSPLINHNTQDYFPPASTLKVVTALAAKLSLGDDFRFTTTLSTAGNDVIIRYTGDPSFSRQDLRAMLRKVKATTGKQIDTLWLDNRAFSGYSRAVGWPWDILGVCYSAPASAITLDGNCVQGALYTNNDGTTRIHVPAHQPIVAMSTARSVTKQQQQDQHCDLELRITPENRYSLDGCVVQRQSPLPLNFAVSSPARFAQAVIRDELDKLGVTITGNINVGAPENTTLTERVNHYSAPLPELLATMLRDSNNLYADNILKTIGATHFKQSGSFNNGTAAVKAILKQQADIDLDSSVLVDGSGLSRNNRVTAMQMADVLRYIYHHDADLNLITLLPISGNNGTLKYRQSMRKPPIKGALSAKSGSLFGTYNMMGYGLNSQGKVETMFVQLVTDYHLDKSKVAKPVISPLTNFEQTLYRQVIDYSGSLERSNNKAQP
ncbi:serine-type D-Ala-D-Ala carboxypeptidase [Vibrio methylphosphonaticus]|uniref:serine-type D-Ala-D-Ala carboxypeptidase n=1 Tax=Vibrio methylphosphonaticus TaxID=2946866 RepID=UPI00202AA359|nr:serine-type D-Ala-D-Ala carboxypeptidase [Vibrio methylphosphonaticus]MCL9773354.1 serine-type D-Ala-D-Ala carboxypeptidase [Vibrio methylphosphonaticus]